MNKKVKLLIFIIISSFLILINNNLRDIFKYILENKNNISFLNLSIVSSIFIIIFSSFLNYHKYINKWYLFFISIVVILFNFIEGYIDNFSSFPFLILYFYVNLFSFCLLIHKVKNYDISVVFSISIMLISCFIFGLFGLLKIYKYFMILLFIFMIYYIYKQYKSDRINLKNTFNRMFNLKFVFYSVIWIMAVFSGSGLYVHSWDEYSHWAYDAKSMIYYSKFGASQEIMIKTRGYAPIFTVWHYIISIFGGFSEHNLYAGLNILIGTFLMPALHYIKRKRLISAILTFIVVMFVSRLFDGVYSYSSLYADYAITVVFASILIIYDISKKENINCNKLLGLLLIILTLSKPNGFVISFVSLIIILVNELISVNEINLKKICEQIINLVKKYYKYFLCIVITVVLWKIYLYLMSTVTNEYYNSVVLPDSLKSDLQYKLNSEFIRNFIKQLFSSFDKPLINCNIKLSLYQYMILFISGITFLYYYETNNIRFAMKKVVSIIIGYIAFYTLTVLAIFVAMSKYEASNLASFGRYLNWFHLGILIYTLYYISKVDYSSHKQISFANIVYIAFIILIPFSSLCYFFYNPTRGESYGVYLKNTRKFKILNKYTEKDSMVYVIDQQDKDGIMAMWYSRYYAFPRQINASSSSISWKIKTKKNKDDLQNWGLTANKWKEHLIKYNFDYVYMYTSDTDFFKETSSFYYDVNKAKKYKLFRVVINNGDLKLIPII